MPLRLAQLDLRNHEIHEAFTSMRDLVAGNKNGLELIDGKDFAWDLWKGKVETEKNVVLAGHSFGGATAVSKLLWSGQKHDPLMLEIAHNNGKRHTGRIYSYSILEDDSS